MVLHLLSQYYSGSRYYSYFDKWQQNDNKRLEDTTWLSKHSMLQLHTNTQANNLINLRQNPYCQKQLTVTLHVASKLHIAWYVLQTVTLKNAGNKQMSFTVLPLPSTTLTLTRNKIHGTVEYNLHTCIISIISVVMMSFSIMCSINSFKTSCFASITRFFFRASWWHRCMPQATSILAEESKTKPNSTASNFPTSRSRGSGQILRAAVAWQRAEGPPPLA